MWDKLEQIEKHYQELEEQIAIPEVASDRKQLEKLGRERASLEEIVTAYRRYKALLRTLEDTRAMLKEGLDEEMRSLVKQEIDSLEPQLESLQEDLKQALLPRDENDERNIIVEIRAGTGGEEAALFAADLFRMYSRYAQTRGWDIDIMNTSEAGSGFR
ncbi:MAG: PCRF domain-containing protein [Chloroflexi bacterium]|nr:PCRF domain-containing protein [Chloroflexota bacterium]